MNKSKYGFKYAGELGYWRKRFVEEGYQFDNAHYESLMLDILQRPDKSIFEDKIIGDFGCGPRGSLKWITNARTRLGLDVLVPEYMGSFPNELKQHEMIYVTTSESQIPLPDNFLDILFTINSFDHVVSPRLISKELLRIMKKGAIFAASFNLYEPATLTEPQILEMKDIENYFLPHLENAQIRLAAKDNEVYGNIRKNKLLAELDPAIPTVLWLTGNKK